MTKQEEEEALNAQKKLIDRAHKKRNIVIITNTQTNSSSISAFTVLHNPVQYIYYII